MAPFTLRLGFLPMNEDELDHLLNELIQRLQHLDEDDLNDLLEALIRRVQQQPPKTPARRRALNCFAKSLQQSPWFKRQRPSRQTYPDRYDQIYAEATSLFWERVCRGIDGFRTGRSRAALRWIIFLLSKCVADASRLVLGDPNVKVRSLDELEPHEADPAAPDLPPSLSEQVDACIAQDSQDLCQKHIEGFPQATFQAIYQLKREGRSLQEIADQLGITSQQTIHSFYNRQLKLVSPQIKAYIQEYGQF